MTRNLDYKRETKGEKVRIDGYCPSCGGDVIITATGYACVNCDFFIRGVIGDRRIRQQEAEDFLQGKNIPIDGFYRFDKEVTFPSFLRFSKEKGVFLDSRVGKCPRCGGTVRIGKKAFNCENFSKGCKFYVYRNISGHEISYEEISQLLSCGKTSKPVTLFDSDGNTSLKRIAINKKKNISFL
ncbi:MAG: type IA DNA topoisomerase [Bacteroidales bacterium]|nr:type IA DNA topoisomerase [Bacteroidales bacterium]